MKAAPPVFELAEWQSRLLPEVRLSPEDYTLVEQLGGEAGRVDIDELRTGVRVRARSWIGIIRFSTFQVRIVPKLAGDNLGLVEMLAFTTGLDALRRNMGVRGLHLKENGHLLDLVMLLFAEACEQVLQIGLLHDYVEQEVDLPILRGRLLINKQLRQRFGRLDRLECRYDDHLSDILENQILAAALAAYHHRVEHPGVRLRIHRLYSLFTEACSLPNIDLPQLREGLTYHRLNDYYREAHELAWVLLQGLGIEDLLRMGQTPSFAFLLDMNQLFELFILRLIEGLLRDLPYRVHYQRRDRSIIWDVIHKRPYTQVIPDLLIETISATPRRLAIDAKYKLYDQHRLSPADIYQSFLYAYAYRSEEITTPEALLLYPTSQPASTPLRLQIRSTVQQTGATLQALGIHIPQALAEIRTKTSGQVTRLLLEVIGNALSIC